MRTSAIRFSLSLVVGLLGISFAAHAQLPGATPGGINAALIRLFGDVNAFSAQTEVRVLDKSQQETLNAPMEFALLDKKIRVALDMGQMKGKDVPPGATDALKQMGMARMVSLVMPEKKTIHIIYPDQKCYMDLALPPEESEGADKTAKVERTELGKETLDGHPCVKNKVVIAAAKGQPLEATTWNASDLKDFPIQIQTEDKGNTTIMRFKKVQLSKPEAKDFEVPTGYKQYNDQQELMLGVMRNAAAAGEKK
jgi:hypothetical protein